MTNHRLFIFIALALIACMTIAGTALAGPKSYKPSCTCSTKASGCPTTTSSTTTSSTCPTTSATSCTCPTTTTTRPACAPTTTVKPASVKYGANTKPWKAQSANERFGRVAGMTVLDTTDTAGKAVTKPLGGVHVRLLNSKGKVVRATLSKKDGTFVFKNVKPNADNALYTITTKTKRYKRVNTMTITVDVDKGKTTNIAEIHFKK